MDLVDNRPIITKKERRVLDSKIEVTYPEKTWSIEQSYRDIYQNHLDAQFKICVNELLGSLSDFCKTDTRELLGNRDLRKVAYEFLATKGVIDPETRQTMLDFLVLEAERITGKTVVDRSQITESLERYSVRLPKIEILTEIGGNATGWVDGRSISQAEIERSTVLGWRISDEGDGYDATLKSILHSSGKESPDQIGKFGEGGKMSEIYVKERGFWIESRSAYNFTDEEGEHCVLWKSRPGKSPEGSMEVHVTKVELDKPIPTGSVTEIRFQNNGLNEFERMNFIDCIKSRDNSQILYDSPISFQEKFIYSKYNPKKPLIGVSNNLRGLMVQGVRVEPINTGSDLAFGYSVFDKEALDARDRNKYSDKFLEAVTDFWTHADKEALELYVDRFFFGDETDRDTIPFHEAKILNKLVQFGFDGKDDDRSKELGEIRKTLLDIISKRFVLDNQEKIYFKHMDDSPEFLSRLDFEPVEIVDISGLGLFFFENTLKEYFGDRYISRSEIGDLFRDRDRTNRGDTLNGGELRTANVWLSERYGEVSNLLSSLEVERKLDDMPEVVFVSKGPLIGLVKDDDDEYDNKVLQINWNLAKKIDDYTATNRLLAVYLLAMNRSGFYFFQSQNVANRAIDENWRHVLNPDFLELGYNVDIEVLRKMIEGTKEFEISRMNEYFSIVESLSKSTVDSSDLAIAIGFLDRFKGLEADQLELISRNIYKTSSGFAKIVMDHDTKKYKIENFELDQMKVLGEVQGKMVYKHGGYVFIEILSFDYAKHKETIVYKHGNTLYRSTPAQAISWETETSTDKLKFIDGYCYFEAWNGDSDENSLLAARVELEKLKLVDSSSRDLSETWLEDGHVSTSVSLEYGKGNWDNPVRFFEDVVQNHLSAGNVELRYSVSRSDGEVWVLAIELLASDTIVGIEFSDDGKGYAPESLERMGKTEKDSPLDLGKYGEGAKMLLGAASRNQITLEFSSVCIRGEESINWTAKAERKEVDIIENGKKSIVSLAGFDLRSRATSATRGSKTRIMFSDLDSEFYGKCLGVIDPRPDGKGLAKYVRHLEGGVKVVGAVGPISLLDDDSGDIFENGLLVTRKNNLLKSIDVPDVTATRERNEIKERRFRQYIDFLLSHTSDEEVIAKVLDKLLSCSNYNYFDVCKIFEESGPDPINAGTWRDVMNKKYRGAIIDDVYIMDINEKYLEYSGYSRRIHVSGNSGSSTFLKSIAPSVSQLIKQDGLTPIDVPKDVESKVWDIVDSLSDEVLKIIDGGILPEASNREFVEILRDKEKLHASIKYSRIHPFILGEAKGESTTIISEYLLGDPDEIAMVVLHEWAHHLTNKGDLDPKFIACLLGLAAGLNV